MTCLNRAARLGRPVFTLSTTPSTSLKTRRFFEAQQRRRAKKGRSFPRMWRKWGKEERGWKAPLP